MYGCIAAFLALAFLFGGSWLLTCGMIFLIAFCFELEFSWRIATGIWLILILIGGFCKSDSSDSKK